MILAIWRPTHGEPESQESTNLRPRNVRRGSERPFEQTVGVTLLGPIHPDLYTGQDLVSRQLGIRKPAPFIVRLPQQTDNVLKEQPIKPPVAAFCGRESLGEPKLGAPTSWSCPDLTTFTNHCYSYPSLPVHQTTRVWICCVTSELSPCPVQDSSSLLKFRHNPTRADGRKGHVPVGRFWNAQRADPNL